MLYSVGLINSEGGERWLDIGKFCLVPAGGVSYGFGVTRFIYIDHILDHKHQQGKIISKLTID